MKKKLLTLCLMASLVMMFSLTGCAKSGEGSAAPSASSATEEQTSTAEEQSPAGTIYGYTGEDPMELAAYRYMAEEISKHYDKADASIPTVQIVYKDTTDPGNVAVYGSFWVENYAIKDDTLLCVSGGHYAGVMHMSKSGEDYTVTSFDQVEDGSSFDPSAREIFGDHYDDFMAVYSDDNARTELRKSTVAEYVKANGLAVTKYQDEGWDPVDLVLE